MKDNPDQGYIYSGKPCGCHASANSPADEHTVAY
jgi:hypothetical protein